MINAARDGDFRLWSRVSGTMRAIIRSATWTLYYLTASPMFRVDEYEAPGLT